MTCIRCLGLVIKEHDELRCLNCGHRPIPIEPQPLCKGRYQNGQCWKSPVRGSDYCLQHEREEVAKRKALVAANNLGEL